MENLYLREHNVPQEAWRLILDNRKQNLCLQA